MTDDKQQDPRPKGRLAARIARRFSFMNTIAVALLVVSCLAVLVKHL